MNKHPETFISLEELGRKIPAYQPTFDFSKKYINRSHRYFSSCPGKELIELKTGRWFGEKIEGWLRHEDALKLYEIAYFVSGEILELGTYRGLSTTILAQATRESGHQRRVYTVDMNQSDLQIAIENLKKKKLIHCVHPVCADAMSIVRKGAAEGRKFEFVFIDHSHEFEPVYKLCLELGKIAVPGGFCLFHDFNDERNRDTANTNYGVYQAVTTGLDPELFEFYGIYGCTALYRRTSKNVEK